MRRLLSLCSALLILAASTAHAGQGVNLRWSSCFGDGGAVNRDFACNTNSGSNVLVGSFEVGSSLQQVSGQRIGLDLMAASTTLPDWWAFRNAGTCRLTSLGVNFVVSPTAVNCVDWTSGQGLGGVGAYLIGIRGPSSARMFMTQAFSNFVADLDPGIEYFSFNATINNAKTVGSPACGGCAVPVCLALSYVELTFANTANLWSLHGGTNGTNNTIFTTWQGPVPVPPGGKECPWPVRVRQETWGAVKSLYR